MIIVYRAQCSTSRAKSQNKKEYEYNAQEPLCTKRALNICKRALVDLPNNVGNIQSKHAPLLHPLLQMKMNFIKSSPSAICDIFGPLPQSPLSQSSLSVCLYLSVCVCLCLFPSVSDSISVCHCLCLCLLPVSCLSLSLYHSLHIFDAVATARAFSFPPSLPPSLPPHLALL